MGRPKKTERQITHDKFVLINFRKGSEVIVYLRNNFRKAGKLLDFDTEFLLLEDARTNKKEMLNLSEVREVSENV